MESSATNAKNVAAGFAKNNPWIMFGAIAILIVIILIMYFRVPCATKKGKKKGNRAANEDDELDQLILSINTQQKTI